jgi:hypothetical protein
LVAHGHVQRFYKSQGGDDHAAFSIMARKLQLFIQSYLLVEIKNTDHRTPQ